jgi:hypothetical protein
MPLLQYCSSLGKPSLQVAGQAHQMPTPAVQHCYATASSTKCVQEHPSPLGRCTGGNDDAICPPDCL